METYDHYKNGVWETSASGTYFKTKNPYTGEVWAKIARGNAQDVDRAVRTAKAAFESPWDDFNPTAWGKLRVRLAELIERDCERLGGPRGA